MRVENPSSIHDGITTGYATLHDISSRHSRIMAGRRQFCIKGDDGETRTDYLIMPDAVYAQKEMKARPGRVTFSRHLLDLYCDAPRPRQPRTTTPPPSEELSDWKIDRSLFPRHFWGGCNCGCLSNWYAEITATTDAATWNNSLNSRSCPGGRQAGRQGALPCHRVTWSLLRY